MEFLTNLSSQPWFPWLMGGILIFLIANNKGGALTGLIEWLQKTFAPNTGPTPNVLEVPEPAEEDELQIAVIAFETLCALCDSNNCTQACDILRDQVWPQLAGFLTHGSEHEYDRATHALGEVDPNPPPRPKDS